MRKASKIGLAVVAGATVSLMTAGTAMAGGGATPKATGSVAIASHAYMSFNAFDYGSTGDRGTVDYSDFAYTTGTAGSGVWKLGNADVTFTDMTGSYVHNMTIDSVTPLSTTVSAFTGHGAYSAPPPAYTWNIAGNVVGNVVTFRIDYNQLVSGASYYVVGSGHLNPDGSVTDGTSTASDGDSLTWTLPAGSAVEVLHYRANVTQVSVAGAAATFDYTIPPGALGGTPVEVSVTDGGSSAVGNDTMTINGSAYPLTSGNLVVH